MLISIKIIDLNQNFNRIMHLHSTCSLEFTELDPETSLKVLVAAAHTCVDIKLSIMRKALFCFSLISVQLIFSIARLIAITSFNHSAALLS